MIHLRKEKNFGVRKGSRILAKSRIFEPDQVSPKAARDFVDVSIDVSGKKDWLKGAFERKEVEDEEIKTTIIETNVEVTSKAKWLQEMAFKKKDEEPGSQLKQLSIHRVCIHFQRKVSGYRMLSKKHHMRK